MSHTYQIFFLCVALLEKHDCLLFFPRLLPSVCILLFCCYCHWFSFTLLHFQSFPEWNHSRWVLSAPPCKGFDQHLTSQNSKFLSSHIFQFLKWHPGSLPHPFYPYNKDLLSIAIKHLKKKGLVLVLSYLGSDSFEVLENIEVVYKTSLGIAKGKLKEGRFLRKWLMNWVFRSKFSEERSSRQAESMDWLSLQKMWVLLRSHTW